MTAVELLVMEKGELVGQVSILINGKGTEVEGDFLSTGFYGMTSNDVEKMIHRKAQKEYKGNYSIFKSYSI